MLQPDLSAQSHSDRGLKRLFTIPQVYRLFGRLISRKGTAARLAANYVRPYSGARILDLGCGPGNLPDYLPESIGEYCGVDINPSYVDAARERWKHRPSMRFICEDATSTRIQRNHYDIVTAIALVHHLDDATAGRVFASAFDALAPGGRLITWDCVSLDHQNPLARWLISMDRGRAVRNCTGYRRLAERYFDRVESRILHDTLRVPYAIYAMTCTKGTER